MHQVLTLLENSGQTRGVEYIDYLSYTSGLHAYEGDVKTAYVLVQRENELLEKYGWQDSYSAVHARHNLVFSLVQMGEFRTALTQQQAIVTQAGGGSRDGQVEALHYRQLGSDRSPVESAAGRVGFFRTSHCLRGRE